jgi:hypothetical protein
MIFSNHNRCRGGNYFNKRTYEIRLSIFIVLITLHDSNTEQIWYIIQIGNNYDNIYAITLYFQENMTCKADPTFPSMFNGCIKCNCLDTNCSWLKRHKCRWDRRNTTMWWGMNIDDIIDSSIVNTLTTCLKYSIWFCSMLYVIWVDFQKY